MKTSIYIISFVYLFIPLTSIGETNKELCSNNVYLKCMKLDKTKCESSQNKAMKICLTKKSIKNINPQKEHIKFGRVYGECISYEYLTIIGSNKNIFNNCLKTSKVIKSYEKN